MRRFLLLLCFVAVPLLAGTVSRTARLDPGDLVITPADGYDVVELPDAAALVRPGAPRLPRVVEAVVIPAGAVPVRVELTSEEWTDVPGTCFVAPAQPDVPLPMPGRDFMPAVVPPDPALYGSSEWYPGTTVELLEPGTMGGYRIAHVELHPVRWLASTGRLQVATRLSYRLEYAGNADARVATGEQQSVFGDLARSFVANPGDVRRFAPRVAPSAGPAFVPPGYYEYVVISEPPLDTVFQRLADWKTLRGIPATVVKVSWISDNYTGYDLPEKIRNFIIDARANWGTVYVLLGGAADYKTSGENIVPCRLTYYINSGVGGYPDEDDIPCDLYYAGLDGSWDRDGDHTYGERSDSADMYSDVFVGRASVADVAQAQNFVYKALTYEGNPPAGYLRKMLLPTAILWSSYEERPGQDSIARMTPAGWLDAKLYERNGNLSRQAVRDSLSAGFGMGHWIGHGDEDGIYMSSTPYLNSTDADVLTNGDKLGINSSIACFTGAWDETPNGDCFAEHLVNRVGGGLVASAMNSRYGWGAYVTGVGYVPGPSERLDTVFHAVTITGDLYHAGEALAAAKSTWVPYADSGNQYDMQRWCIYELNLIGDPELSLWTDEPESLVATHPGVVTIGTGVPYTVTVTTGADAPIESALVLLWKGSEVYTKGRTNASGQVTLSVSALTPGPMVLTVNARNYYLLVDTVQVIATARYVVHLRSSILDPAPGGNNDSILNPGESVKVPTWVKNWGQQTATSVTGTLRTHDSHAVVTDSVRSFGNIAAGDSAYTGDNGFGLQVTGGLANGYAIACSLFCRDVLDSTWVSSVTYYVGTPVLVPGAVTVRDSAHGNSNGRVDPGEIADLEIEVANEGIGHGYACLGVLRSTDARFLVTDSTADFGFIPAGGSVVNTGDHFAVHADGSIPMETAISCTLQLSADGGYVVREPVTIVVGIIREIDPIPDGPRTPALYWAYDECDVSYPAQPEYDWVEINGVGTQLNYPHNDDVQVVTLPGTFGPFKFYGQSYSELSVSADGWLCPGNYTTRHYRNYELPGDSTPPGVICANWDDLYPGEGNEGYVYWYHDAANHRLVIEYDSLAYYNARTTRDKFEVVIYDTTVTTPSGDNRIVVQYMTANNYTSSTLGIEDPGRTIAIQALFNGTLHRGCESMGPGRAIAYVTDPPNQVGVTEDGGAARPSVFRFGVWPTPFRSRATVSWSVVLGGKVSLVVYDAVGREVRRLVDCRQTPGHYSVDWDGRAGNGQRVAPGVYFCKLETAAGCRQQKLVLAR